MVARPVVRYYCLPENLDKVWLHVVWHCPAVKSADVAERERLNGAYLTAVTLPSSTVKNDFTLCPMPPQTITETP